ncbi:DUF1903-domain-containing protein [Auriculariales sp. MPI-PUGE-AT-0066]|nr:DUF1903-domain-containing protein [Auriculariales sp. MPI-PUGE-AT-0066]
MPTDSAHCQAQACDLQACLNKNTYTPEKCDTLVRKLYECCGRMYDKDNGASSTACPSETILRRWFKNHPTNDAR